MLDAACAKVCRKCKYWYPFDQYYEDPLEPDDFGHCKNEKSGLDSTAEDDTCDHWTQWETPNANQDRTER